MSTQEQQAEALKNNYVDSLVQNNFKNAHLQNTSEAPTAQGRRYPISREAYAAEYSSIDYDSDGSINDDGIGMGAGVLLNENGTKKTPGSGKGSREGYAPGEEPGAVPIIPGTGDGDGKGPGKGDGSGKNRALGVSDERAYCIGLHPHPQGECAAGWKCVRSKMGRKVY